jgi:ATP-dependent Lon protease
MVVFPRKNQADVDSLPHEAHDGLKLALVEEITELTSLVLLPSTARVQS